MTVTAADSSFAAAVLNPVNPSRAKTSALSRQACGRSVNDCLKACLERPSTMPSSLAGSVPSRMPVRSMIVMTSSRRPAAHPHIRSGRHH